MSGSSFKLRLWTLLSAAVVVPLGFALKLYSGPAHGWVNHSLAGVTYEIFWCLALFLVWPRRSAINRIVIGVLLATAALEMLQLWDHPWLERIRSTLAGRALIGTTFAPSDFVYYVIGTALGWLCLRGIAPAADDAQSRGSGAGK